MNEEKIYYDFDAEEWSSFTESYREGVRRWAYDFASKSGNISTIETEAYTNYISGTSGDGHRTVYDSIFGPKYKYKSFFQTVQDRRNADYFAVVEKEQDEIRKARGYLVPPNDIRDLGINEALRTRNGSYSGCDITPSITIGSKTFAIGNISTLTYSIHRDKVPVRTLGRSYPKSFVSAGISIAGSLVFTVFDTHVLNEIRNHVVYEKDTNKVTSSPLTQQLPPFDITIFYQNEYGHASYLRIYGIEITDEAQTHSINDIYSENVMQYVARDIDLMCKIGDKYTPQFLQAGNTSIFTEQNFSNPAYKLRNFQENEKKIGELQTKLARINNELNALNTKISETVKPPETPEKINLLKAYDIQYTTLNTEAAKINSEIDYTRQRNETQLTSESTTNLPQYRYGSETSDGRDNPYALNRGKSL